MKSEEIMKNLDELDKFIRENIQSDGKFKNTENAYARMNIGVIQKIRKELEEENIGGFIRNRVEQTENALLYATNRANLTPNNKYFQWLNATMQSKDTKPDYNELYYSVCTGHNAIVYASYAREYLPEDVPNREELLYNFEVLQKEYEVFLSRDREVIDKEEKALTVIKRNPIQKFFDKIFNRDGKKENRKQTKSAQTIDNQTTNLGRENGHNKYCKELRDPKNYSQAPIYQTPKIEKTEQIVVISDMHGDLVKWEWIKQAMIENPNMKIIVLGDAMDRGENGLEILLQIKELCDQGRAQYLPGNHDVFAYNYVKVNEILNGLSNSEKMQNDNLISIAGRELAHLEKNGGESTLEQLDNFDKVVRQEIRNGNIKQNISKTELIDWLGKQPIQRKIRVNNETYALSHAYFDEELYNYDNQFNMQKALQMEINRTNNVVLNKFRTAMWYREGHANTQYSSLAYPKDCVMIVRSYPTRRS